MNPNLVLPVGTRIVTRVEVKTDAARALRPVGAVAEIVVIPADADLALKANPNVLECLWTPLVELTTPLADELLRMREVFLSKLVYQTYNGYVLGQFKKLEQDLRVRGEVRWKHVMHLVRLLLSGIALLRDGIVVVRVEEYRDRLLAIRDGGLSWEEVDAWRLELHGALDAASRSAGAAHVPSSGIRVNELRS